jgi:hypothetical protein
LAAFFVTLQRKDLCKFAKVFPLYCGRLPHFYDKL